MGRGGGSAAKHSGGGGGGGGGGGVVIVGKANPVVSGICYAILAVIFLILTIAVPVCLIIFPAGDPCAPAKSLNWGEQMVCKPPADELDEKYIAEAASSKIKVYREKSEKFGSRTTRKVTYANYQTTLSAEYDDFSISAPLGVEGDITIKVTRNSYVYWVPDSKLDGCFDADGVFIDSYCTSYRQGDKVEKDKPAVTISLPYREVSVMHLIVSSYKEKNNNVVYTLNLYYNIYDLSGLTPQSCKNDCEFDDMKAGEWIVMDYPDTTGSDDTMYYDASIHNNDINWSAVGACAAIFAILTLICIILAVFYLIKILKKIGKLGKKAVKKIEKEREKEAAADAAAAQQQPAVVVTQGDPNYGQQPYPGQPYPGQPM